MLDSASMLNLNPAKFPQASGLVRAMLGEEKAAKGKESEGYKPAGEHDRVWKLRWKLRRPKLHPARND